MILRKQYIDRIAPFYYSDFIKVLVGVRRCGKSVLLRQIADDVSLNADSNEHIEFISFEDYANRKFLDADVLYDYLQNVFSSYKKVDLFLDEVQLVENFEKIVNSIHAKKQANIFMTGSNSKILSGELETLLGGRTLSFRIMPFNFREFCEFNALEKSSNENDLKSFLKWGGMPLVCAERSEEQKAVIVDNLYSSVVLRDIVNRSAIGSPVVLQNILDYLIANSSLMISGNNIAKELSKRTKVSPPTVYDYVEAIRSSYIIDLVSQYDIRGKCVLSNNKKGYVCDLGFFALMKNRTKDEMSNVIETAVYNELISRGYSVFVGKLYGSEIDFVVQSGKKKAYIQAAYLLSSQNVFDREFGAFKSVHDNYPKYVISCDPMTIESEYAKHLPLFDFLNGEEIF